MFTRSTRSRAARTIPADGLPVLSRGKHRDPRRGACFMEFASYLAGEAWSDRPDCTHPALASLARLVNDWTSDAERSALATLVPDVIGLRGDTERVDLLIAILAASAALPIASESRQRVLALGLLRCVARLQEVRPFGAARLRDTASSALAQVPAAARWAAEQADPPRFRAPRSDVPLCDAITGLAVAGIGEACVDGVDERLRELLRRVITECSLELGCGRPAPVRRGATAMAAG